MKTKLVTLADGRKIVHIGTPNRILAARELEELEALVRDLAESLNEVLEWTEPYHQGDTHARRWLSRAQERLGAAQAAVLALRGAAR